MKTRDFYYDLPEELIAQHPIENRSESKLLILDKETNNIEHKKFKNIIQYLNKGDTLVLNDTRVIPARIFGHRIGKEESIEFLLLRSIEKDTWMSLVRPGKKARIGRKIEFGKGELVGEIIGIEEDGSRIIRFEYQGVFKEILDKLGQMPLPPYIKERLEDKERYQTVFSRESGSAAAPTAGLHFTDELLKKIKAKGINIAFITLHVGLATFRPVKAENIEDHHMHSEFYTVSEKTANIINNTRRNGKRIISVGTTTTRTLEAIVDEKGLISPESGWTDIFIYPGYNFKIVDALITNFHLPESSLMMLVSAFVNRESILNTYNIAIEKKYRFFSFGDAMLIK